MHLILSCLFTKYYYAYYYVHKTVIQLVSGGCKLGFIHHHKNVSSLIPLKCVTLTVFHGDIARSGNYYELSVFCHVMLPCYAHTFGCYGYLKKIKKSWVTLLRLNTGKNTW